MNCILNAASLIAEHLCKNISNYLLFTGLGIVLFFIRKSYGFMPFILSVGILLILSAIVIELNRSASNKKKNRY